MNKEDVINKIGKGNWSNFCKFMAGQTVGFQNGVIDFYEHDVDKFIRLYLS